MVQIAQEQVLNLSMNPIKKLFQFTLDVCETLSKMTFNHVFFTTIFIIIYTCYSRRQ